MEFKVEKLEAGQLAMGVGFILEEKYFEVILFKWVFKMRVKP